MNKPIQYFTEEYLKLCQKMTPDEIVEFLENFRQLADIETEKSIPISLRVEPKLLSAFKAKAKLHNVSYQTKIKELMRLWLEN